MYEIHKTYDITDSSIFLSQVSLPKVYRMLTFVYDFHNDIDANDDATANTYTDDDMYSDCISTAVLYNCAHKAGIQTGSGGGSK